MILLSSKSITRNFKIQAYLSLIAFFTGLYIFYYIFTDYTYYLNDGLSFFDYFSDKLEERLLLVILGCLTVVGFMYFWKKRTLVYKTEYSTHIEILQDQKKSLKHYKVLKLKFLKGVKTILSEDKSQSEFLDNLDNLTSFREEEVVTKDSATYSISEVTGSNNYATGTSNVLTKKRYKGFTEYRVFAVYSDNTEKEISYGKIRASKFEEVFSNFFLTKLNK